MSPGESRLFVPLSSRPFGWFSSGRKRWELRRLGRQYTPRHLVVGRRVELRLGYSTGRSLWGFLAEVKAASSIGDFMEAVPFDHVIPDATDAAQATGIAHGILGDGNFDVIGFRVELDPVAHGIAACG